MVERVLIDVNASPDAFVVCPDRYDAEAWLNALEMSFPKVVRRRLTDNASFTVLFAIFPLLLNLIRAISNVKAREYRLELRYILHLLSFGGKKATLRWPLIAWLEMVLGWRSHSLAVFAVLDLDGPS